MESLFVRGMYCVPFGLNPISHVLGLILATPYYTLDLRVTLGFWTRDGAGDY